METSSILKLVGAAAGGLVVGLLLPRRHRRRGMGPHRGYVHGPGADGGRVSIANVPAGSQVFVGGVQLPADSPSNKGAGLWEIAGTGSAEVRVVPPSGDPKAGRVEFPALGGSLSIDFAAWSAAVGAPVPVP